jgi:hypothetical protein
MISQIIKLFAKLLTPRSRKFRQGLLNPESVQAKVQLKIFQNLLNSDYGKSLNIKSLADWDNIPIVEYHNIENWIEQQKENKKPLLSDVPILFYQKTSGSRGAAKLIPYTKSLLGSFNQMFCIWAHDLISYGVKLSTGKIYFCISPQLGDENTGLEDDSQYLDSWLQWILTPFLVSPQLKGVSDVEEFKNKLAQTLLLEKNLEIISIWSPTFLKVILDYIEVNRYRLCEELGNRISPERCQVLLTPPIPWNLVWPKLKLISCWDSANAADGAEFLRNLFPGVLVQGKGLLATEAPMTIPLVAAQGYVPVIDEVFFEFEDEAGKILLLHELEKGEVYELILSQQGGLYRYRIGDRIRVTHFYFNTPCLEFLGRTRDISDLVGEKLHCEFVRQVLDSLPLQDSCFKSLVPVKVPNEHYILLLDQANLTAWEIAEKLDTALKASPQYYHARLLGQLNCPRVLISPRIPEIVSLYKAQSQKWGDLKHDLLSTTPIELDLLQKLEKLRPTTLS